jgi:hypothetical protein
MLGLIIGYPSCGITSIEFDLILIEVYSSGDEYQMRDYGCLSWKFVVEMPKVVAE